MTTARLRWAPHPIIVVLITVPALFVVLVARAPWFGLVAIGVCMVATAGRGWRFAAAVGAGAGALFVLLRLGMGFWLPAEAALTGAVRITAMGVLLVVPFAFVNWPVLADTLVRYCRVPYRVMDTVMLGERFVALMRSDLRVIADTARLRSRGSIRRRAALLGRSMLPVLVASFRHSDELAIAMDARGFGAYATRTVHRARPMRAADAILFATVSAVTILLAVLLEGVPS